MRAARWRRLMWLGLTLGMAACAAPAATAPGPLPSPISLPTVSLPPFPTAIPTSTRSLPTSPAAPQATLGLSPTASATFEPFPFKINADEPARGPADAPVTIIQYGDFHGQYDALLEPALRRVLSEHPGEVRLIWRPFPVMEVNDKAYYAAVAAEAARRQGRFWQMHDLLFDTYHDWAMLPPQQFWGKLDEFADEIGLDKKQLADDLTTGGVMQAVLKDYEEARSVGVPGTPALIINRTPYTGPLEYSVLERTVRLELLRPRQYAQYPDTVIDTQRVYSAVLNTDRGKITFALYARQAPVAVNSFVFLAHAGWYDGNTFYRVLPGEAAFTGDPSGTGLGGPGYLFAGEIDPKLKFDRPGVVALNNAGPDTNGSQFFITFAPLPQLDGDYTIIGQVNAGLSVLSRLTPRDPEADPDAPPGDKIKSVTISEG